MRRVLSITAQTRTTAWTAVMYCATVEQKWPGRLSGMECHGYRASRPRRDPKFVRGTDVLAAKAVGFADWLSNHPSPCGPKTNAHLDLPFVSPQTSSQVKKKLSQDAGLQITADFPLCILQSWLDMRPKQPSTPLTSSVISAPPARGTPILTIIPHHLG